LSSLSQFNFWYIYESRPRAPSGEEEEEEEEEIENF
jgi:hypothetical protein